MCTFNLLALQTLQNCVVRTLTFWFAKWRRNEFESGVGGTGPERKWGHRSGTKRRKKFFGRAPPLFGSESTISRFGERFRDG